MNYTNMHRCYAEGCRRPVRMGQLMCREHWFRVPKDIQAQVYAAWRAINRPGMNPTKLQRYRDAIDAARDSLKEVARG